MKLSIFYDLHAKENSHLELREILCVLASLKMICLRVYCNTAANTAVGVSFKTTNNIPTERDFASSIQLHFNTE